MRLEIHSILQPAVRVNLSKIQGFSMHISTCNPDLCRLSDHKNRMSKSVSAMFMAVFLALHTFDVFAADQAVSISLRALAPHIAHKIVETAVTTCTDKGYKVSAALVDRNGNLAAFLRHPLSGPHTVTVSQQKAYSSATFQTSTAKMSSRQDIQFAPNILLIVGGLPIDFGGHFYGGIAVSGAEPEVDEECAQAGLDAIAETMEFSE